MSRVAARATARLVAVGLLLLTAEGAFDDNELLGTPEINCNAETIELQFKTRRPFTGKVFVKGNYERPECRVEYGRKGADGQPLGGIRLNHGACNMGRQRTLSPEGMMFSTVLIISFHPLFLTKMDKAYNIKCMYREVVRTVQTVLDVSQLPTEPLALDVALPQCTYTIRKDNLDGEILRFARIGDMVVHRWQCDSEDYGILVHSCVVEDGQGERQQVVDDHGCHADRLLLGDPTYVEKLNMAYREAYVFKFADRVAVRFQCEIRLCFKEDGGCDGITPPICLESNAINESTNNTRRKRRAATKEGDLISQTVYVLDSDEDPPSSLLERRLCLSTRRLVNWMYFLAFVATTIALVALFTALRKGRRRLEKEFACTRKIDFYH